jgi:hypothetical protein
MSWQAEIQEQRLTGNFGGYLTRRGDYRISNRKSKIFEKQSRRLLLSQKSGITPTQATRASNCTKWRDLLSLTLEPGKYIAPVQKPAWLRGP